MLPSNTYQGLLVFEKQGRAYLIGRLIQPSSLGLFSAQSVDGKSFRKSPVFIDYFDIDGLKSSLGDEPAVRAGILGRKTIISFLDKKKKRIFASIDRDGSLKAFAAHDSFNGPTVCVQLPAQGRRKSTVITFASRNSKTIFQSRSPVDLKKCKDMGDVVTVRRKSFDASRIAPLFAELVPQGILMVYSAKNSSGRITVGAALFDRTSPKVMLWRSADALWQMPEEFPASASLIGGVSIGRYFFVYTHTVGEAVKRFPIARVWESFQKKKPETPILPPRTRGTLISLERFVSNPVLEPISKHFWEAFATFNPGATVLDDRVHLLYRAQGYDGLSVLGYAVSSDGIRIDERSDDPVFVSARFLDTEVTMGRRYPYVSGGGTGGCEDPRLVAIGSYIYLIYVAFDGIQPPGIALTFISRADFIAKRWKWSVPKLISQPGKIQKNWVIFPEKIRGKYAILHGLSPKIRVEYVDSLKKLGHGKYIESLASHGGQGYIEGTRLDAWDNIVRGVGAPPLRTEYGWLIFYHGMDMRDPGKYKVGVMLLDLKHPEVIVRRSREPVLEPETDYENSGHKGGVIYVCGAVVKEGRLLVYYGASDQTSAVAMAPLDTFLQSLLSDAAPVLKKMNLKKINH